MDKGTRGVEVNTVHSGAIVYAGQRGATGIAMESECWWEDAARNR